VAGRLAASSDRPTPARRCSPALQLSAVKRISVGDLADGLIETIELAAAALLAAFALGHAPFQQGLPAGTG
jgi:hypothetical protein